jgi:DNA repair photolyase
MVKNRKPVRNILSASNLPFNEIVIRRKDVLGKLAKSLTRKQKKAERNEPDAEALLTPELIKRWGLAGKWSVSGRTPKYIDQNHASTVVFASPMVDVAATTELAQETVDLCELLLRLSSMQMRLLSKSPLLESVVAQKLHERLPDNHTGAKPRVIFGISTGTIDESVAQAIEINVPSLTKRLSALHRLQDSGFRVFGMLCPILPQENPTIYARNALAAIRAEKCEAIWAEPLNLRGLGKKDKDEKGLRDSYQATVEALLKNGHEAQAELLRQVDKTNEAWEVYCRHTFEALHNELQATSKTQLWWLQYPREAGVIPDYWDAKVDDGVLLLGGIVSLYRSSPYILRMEDVAVDKLYAKLRDDDDPISNYVWQKLSPKKREKLIQDSANGTLIGRTLISALNKFLKKPMTEMDDEKRCSWYYGFVSAGVDPSEKTLAFYSKEDKLTDWELVGMNRSLLEDAFPLDIKRLANFSETTKASMPDSPSSSEDVASLQQLERLEEVVRTGWPTFVSVGVALTKIRDDGLYKAVGYKTFEKYCRERLRCCRSTVDRQIAAARVAAILTPIGVEIENESQVRQLAGMRQDDIIEVWKTAAAKPGNRVTAKLIRDAAIELKLPPPHGQNPKPTQNSLPNPAVSLVDQTTAAIENKDLSRAFILLRQLRKMLEGTSICEQGEAYLDKTAA